MLLNGSKLYLQYVNIFITSYTNTICIRNSHILVIILVPRMQHYQIHKLSHDCSKKSYNIVHLL